MAKTLNTQTVSAEAWKEWIEQCSIGACTGLETREQLSRFGRLRLGAALKKVSPAIAGLYCGTEASPTKAWLMVEACLYAGTSKQPGRHGKAYKDALIDSANDLTHFEARLSLKIGQDIARRILTDEGYELSQKNSEGKRQSTWWRMDPLEEEPLSAIFVEPEDDDLVRVASADQAKRIWHDLGPRSHQILLTCFLHGMDDMKAIQASGLLCCKKSQLYNARANVLSRLESVDWGPDCQEDRQRAYMTRRLLSELRKTLTNGSRKWKTATSNAFFMGIARVRTVNMPHQRQTLRLIEVSEARKEFLARWRFERQIARALDAGVPSCTGAETGHAGMSLRARNFDQTVLDGDIRLIPAALTGNPNRILYVAILCCRDNGTALVVPFSEYGRPCCKDEWLTGIASRPDRLVPCGCDTSSKDEWLIRPLSVLQFWNALPVPILTLAQSWKTGELTHAQLEQARELHRHALRGTFPKGALREQVGLAILDPTDDRLAYQREELAIMAGLRHNLFAFLAANEARAKSASRLVKRLLATKLPELKAAGSGGLYSHALVFRGRTRPVCLRALCTDDTDDLTMAWKIDLSNDKDIGLLPGLPAQLHYRAGRVPRTVDGWTTLDGLHMSFDLASERDKTDLRQSCRKGNTRIGILHNATLYRGEDANPKEGTLIMNEHAAPAEQAATATPEGSVTICLSNRTPVRVREADWPILISMDVPVFQVPEAQAETLLLDLVSKQILQDYSAMGGLIPPVLTTLGTLQIVVRQHRDGRTLLYGTKQHAQAVPIGGELLLPDSMSAAVDVSRIIKRLVATCGGRVSAYDHAIAVCLSAVERKVSTTSESCFQTLDGGVLWTSMLDWEKVVDASERVNIQYEVDCTDDRAMEGADIQLRDGNDGPATAVRTIARKVLAVFRSTSDASHLVLGRYLHAVDSGYEAFDVFAPQYAVTVPTVQDVPQAILEIGARLTLKASVIQNCLNALPAEDLL